MGYDVVDSLVVKQLRTGEYVAGTAAAVGYITIKDEAGNDRKLMVQA